MAHIQGEPTLTLLSRQETHAMVACFLLTGSLFGRIVRTSDEMISDYCSKHCGGKGCCQEIKTRDQRSCCIRNGWGAGIPRDVVYSVYRDQPQFAGGKTPRVSKSEGLSHWAASGGADLD